MNLQSQIQLYVKIFYNKQNRSKQNLLFVIHNELKINTYKIISEPLRLADPDW